MLIINGVHLFAQQKSMAESIVEIQLRQLAHRFLLASGDSSSYILPLKQLGNNGYQISFENELAFIPDSLAVIAGQLAQQHQLPVPYTLSITTLTSPDIIYGFTSENLEKGNVPCIGRPLPINKYVINIYFPPVGNSNAYTNIFLAAIPALGLLIYAFLLRRRRVHQEPLEVLPVTDAQETVMIGRYKYLPATGLLTFENSTTPLTGKEQLLLNIFIKQINQVIDRSYLLKVGWEDEGVITGRSLDMYISKLRKKLQQDEGVSIKNVHGKGYSLVVATHKPA
ncbi:helix-turn-helix domain-containing protein [Chitinophaga sp. sic0106]|uniref:helix-turn-helix domain-containing protein n=1 Tax=Chitinophaga sp. sic0106 TaxID=2854785 RepID=UPI001C4958B2|nr:helix-turn-helix domain-containing protein [Chitinophaga sp. sic0106]